MNRRFFSITSKLLTIGLIVGLLLSVLSPALPARAEDAFLSPDADFDGLANAVETAGWYSLAGGPFRTSANDMDSDDDGLTDGEEKLFNTHPLDAHSPGMAVRYEESFKTKQYFSTSDPKYLRMIQGGDRYLLTEALVARRGTSFTITGPASGSLTISGSGMTALTPVKDPAHGGWKVSLPANGTVGTYTATITDGAWSKSMPLYVIFELPASLPEDQIAAFLYDDDPVNKKDEVAVWWRMGEWPYYGTGQSTQQPCPGTDPNTPCSLWQYHGAYGYAQAFWTEQYTKANFVDHAIQAVHGKTTPAAAAPAAATWVDREFRTRSGRMQNNWTSSMYRWDDGSGITMSGGYCETTATVYTSVLRAAGIAARPFALDYNKTSGHGESGQIGNSYEYDHAVMMWLDNTWKAQRAYGGDEVNDLYYPWNSGTTGISLLKDWDTYSGYYNDRYGDGLFSVNEDWDFQTGNGVGTVNTTWANGVPPSSEFVSANRDYYWDSKKPLQIMQSPHVDVLNCQLWKGDNWAPGEWRTPIVSNPEGRDETLTYILPSGVPDPANPLENWPYNPQPTTCSPSTPTSVCNAFKATWTATCPGIVGQSSLLFEKRSDFQVFLPAVVGRGSQEEQSIQLGKITGDSGRDRDGDGRFDELVVEVEVTSATANRFRIGGLLSVGGKTISTESTVSLQPGLQTVEIAFDGQQIGDSGIDGPYKVEYTWVGNMDQSVPHVLDPEKLLAYQDYGHETGVYTAGEFKIQAAVIVDDFSHEGVDTNGNGLIDTLLINIPLKISVPGSYLLEADLYDGQGNFVGHASWTGSDEAASLQFDIVKAQAPYSLEHINLIKDRGPIVDSRFAPDYIVTDVADNVEAGAVAFGSLSGDFQITDVDPNNIFSFTEIDSDSDGLIDILRVNVGVTVTQQGGTYRIEGLLVNALGEPVAWSISDGQSLAVGTRTMTLDFDGKMLFDQLPVGSASESFKLVAIKIFRNNLSSSTLESELAAGPSTKAYSRSDFEPSSPAVTLFEDDLESGTTQWTLSPLWSWDNTTWRSDSHSAKASAAGVANGYMMLNTPLDLSNYAEPELRFNHAYQITNGRLEASTDGTNWTTVATYSGTSPHWLTEIVDLSDFGEKSNVLLRFNTQATNGVTWYVDDIFLNAWPAITSASFTHDSPVAAHGYTEFTASFTSIDPTQDVTYRWNFCGVEEETQDPVFVYQFPDSGNCQVTLTVVGEHDTAVAVPETIFVNPSTNQFTLNINIQPNGSGTVSKDPDKPAYNPGDVVTLTPNPAPGYQFGSWGGACSGTGACVVTMNSNKSVTANFILIEYTLDINTTGNGSVTRNPNKVTYHYGEVVQLTAIPAANWYFSYWDGDVVSSANPTSITIDGDKTVAVTFIQSDITLAVTADGEGTVAVDPDWAHYPAGQQVTLTASPAPGWSFDSWSGDLTSTDNPAAMTMDSTKLVTANFTQDQYSFATHAEGQGTLSKSPDKPAYVYGDEVTVTAAPAPGWSFAGWSGSCTGTGACVVTVDGNESVTATFTEDHYILTVNQVGQGTVTIAPDQPTYTYGTEVTLSAAPELGWSFTGWSGGGCTGTGPCMLTITGDTEVSASFVRIEYDLIVNKVGLGEVLRSNDGPYYYGDEVQLTALSTSGWSFDSWSGDFSGSSNPINITIDNNKEITATFTEDWYTLTVLIDGNGHVDVNPPGPFRFHAMPVLTAYPDRGWTFTNWTGDRVGTANPIGMTVSFDSVVTAHFSPIPYTVTTSTVGQGTVTKSPDKPTYIYGEQVTITPNPAAGWSFDHWSGSCTGSGPCVVTVDGNESVTATFAQGVNTLDVTVVGGGTVTKNPDLPTYPNGATVTLTAEPDSLWYFQSWSGALSGTDNPATITMNGNKSVTATFATNNDAPGQPTLVAPGDGATGVSLSPTLSVTPNDPNGNALDVTFYGKVPTADTFTIVALPDTQNYSTSYPQIFTQQTQWIVDNRDERNIVFVTHEGDITNNGDSAPQEWVNASNAMYILENAVPEVPYSIAHGNHDTYGGGSLQRYEQYFGVSHFQNKPYYGGHYGTNNRWNYELFSAGGMEFVIIHLGYGFNTDVLNWAEGVLQTYSDRRAIVTSHDVMNTNGSFTTNGQAIYDALKDNKNLFLILCGHNHDEARRSDTYDGHTIYSVLADFQTYPNGGNGWLRLLEFSPAEDLIYFKTYSPYLDQWKTDDKSQFTIPYDMDPPTEFQELGAVTDVPAGTPATFDWPELDALSRHEWYVTVTDGMFTTTSPAWTFTTRALEQFSLTVTKFGEGGGTVTSQPSGISCGTTCSANFIENSNVTLTPTADNGSMFTGWNGACSGAGACIVKMDAAKEVGAEFSVAPPLSTASFQEGLDGYAGTVDTYILETSPTTAYGNSTTIQWDTEDTSGNPNSRKYALLRFDNIFGTGTGQIPPGSTILRAQLTYRVSNTAPSAANLHEVAVDWSEALTYNTFGAAPGVQAEDYGSLVTTAPAASTGNQTIDVTSSLAAWVNDPSANLGWIFLPTNTDGADVYSSEYGTATQRPKLVVEFYSSLPPTCYALNLTHSGNGANPTAIPSRSYGCETGSYVAGQVVNLTAAPDEDWHIAGWTGTSNDSSTAIMNSLTMPANDHTAGVIYAEGSAPVTIVFQEGVNGYTGTVDTFVREEAVDTASGSLNGLEWDNDATSGNQKDEITALRFDNIFGTNPGQIPPGATILSASLTYKVSTDSNSQGNAGEVYESLVDWPETVTWNTFGGDAGVNPDEYANLIGQAPATTAGASYSVDVLASLRRWAADPSTNHGWLILPTGSDGVKVWSSEYTTAADRPKLTVEYIAGELHCYSLTLSHTGEGADPVASPANSFGCPAGSYIAGASVTLTAAPASGYQVESWTGTTNDSRTTLTNTVLMPASDHQASVNYVEIPPSAGWTAYNDVAHGPTNYTVPNVTFYDIGNDNPNPPPSSGLLVNFATGENTNVTASLTQSGSPVYNDGSTGTGGKDTDVGTDAYNTFGGITDLTGLVYYGSTGWYVDLTFTGLDPTKTYTFATTANRDVSTYNRVTRFTLSGVEEAVNASTTGVTVVNNYTVAFNTGYNTVNGYVARWTGIRPGSDGSFAVRAQAHSGGEAYAFSVFILKEEPSGPPVCYPLTLTHSGSGADPSASPANSTGCEAGQYVAGENITLTAAPSQGFRVGSWTGTTNNSSSELTNTVHMPASAHTAGVNYVETGGEVTVTFQYGAGGYTGTEDTFIRGTNEGNTNFSTSTFLDWDENSGTTTDEIALMRFNNMFASQGGPIPDGATIVSASLTYMTTDLNSGSTADGDPANVYESLVDWPAVTVTYNNFGGEAGVQADEYRATPVVSAPATARSTAFDIDVTASLQRWSANPAENLGWIFKPTGDDGVTIYSSEAGTLGNRPKLTVTYIPPENVAPNQPVLVSPADGETGVSLSPVLSVTPTDPNFDTLDVTFFANLPGAGEDFTIILIPDPQNASQHAPQMFNAQTNWIVANKEKENIVFVTTAGDMVNTSSSHTQYQNAAAAMDILHDGGVWYSVGPGNHDMAYGTTYYAQYFGRSRFADKEVEDGYWFGGGYDDFNTYSLFSASGIDFILINLQYNPTPAVLDWADALLKTYSDRLAIVEQHDILNVNNSWNNQNSFNALRDNPNLFMMLCGHMHTSTDGAAYRAEQGTDGHTIHIVQADYQEMNNGNGYLRLFRFSPADDKIYMTTYSPYTDQSITTSPDQMELALEMEGSGFTEIGEVNDVASGTTASFTWGGLEPSATYEWYVTVSDGALTATSPTWSFTTTSGVTYLLTVNKAGEGSGTVTSTPPGIDCGAACSASFSEGRQVTLTATPTAGSVFAGWGGACSGTDTCTVTMDAAREAIANFDLAPEPILICESFDSLTAGSRIGSYAGWFGDTNGPTVTSGVGVASTTGLGSGSSIYHWTAHQFNWNAPDFQKFIAQQDFKSSSNGQFDDDRLSWTINSSNTSSNNQFGVQLDHPNGGIVTYWSNTMGSSTRITDPIVPLTTGMIKANTWYRFTVEITKLTATSARIDVRLVELDASGNPTGTPITGSIADTSALGNRGPAAGYFSATSMWPSYKNHTTAAAPADNTCYQVVTTVQQYTLTVNAGTGGSVTRNPDKASYNAGETVTLTAVPAEGYTFKNWDGALSGSTNPITITMDGNKTVTAVFEPETPAPTLICESFDSFTAGSRIGTYPGWFSDASGPTITSGVGVAGTTGLGSGGSVYHWTAHPFNWNAADFQKFIAQQDFKSDGTGQFDDDRLSWTTNSSSTSSDNQFGVQLDPGTAGIVTYWRSGSTRINDRIANLTGIKANTWYRFRVEITKLTSTSARIEVSLVELDAAGNPTGTPITGLVADTSQQGAGRTPNAAYFSASTMWPSYKNHTGASAPADNTCYQVVTTAQQYTLTVNAGTGGSVTKNPDKASYNAGETVTLTAVPADGYTFSGWTGDLEGETDNPFVLTLNGDMTVGATFAANPVTLTINQSVGGTITAAPDGPYHYGQAVTLTATEDTGYTFSGWTGACSGTEKTCNLTLDDDKTVGATFTVNTYTLTVEQPTGGRITPPTGNYNHGTVVELTAEVDEGYTFVAWTGACSDETTLTCSVTMDADKTVGATFERDIVTLMINTIGSGDVTVDPEDPYFYGDVVQLTAIPATGWHFVEWTGDLAGTNEHVTIVLNGSKAVTAVFERDVVTLTIEPATGGTITVEPEGQYLYGDEVTLTATEATGYTFTGWTGDCSGETTTTCNLTLDGDKTVGATFALNTYTLTVEDPTGGTITPATGTYVHGTVVELSAEADDGYRFVEWTGACSDETTTTCYVTMDGDKTVGASFIEINYTLEVTVVGQGSVNRAPDQTSYLPGTEVTLTPNADPGWSFSEWSGDCTGSGACVVTMDGNRSVTATFTEDAYTLDITIDGSGSVEIDPDQSSYSYNTSVTLTPVAAEGYYFTSWSGADADDVIPEGDGSWTIIMNGSKSLTASFELIPPTCYSLNLDHTGEGTDPVATPANSESCETGKYVAGEIIQLSGAIPEPGWQIGSWSGTDDDTSTAATNTLSMPAADRSVAVNYTQIQYTLTVESAHGQVAISGDEAPYTYGESVTLTMGVVDPGWTFIGWSGGGCSGTGPCTVVFTANITVTANFTQNEYALTITQAAGGTIVADPLPPYHLDDLVTLTADPDDGWTFSAWTGDCAGQVNPCTLTMDAAKSVSAVFTQEHYTLTVVSDHGVVSKDPDQETYTYGQSVLLTIGAVDAGWAFTGWSGGGCSGTGPCAVNITGNTEITANFSQDEYSLVVAVDPANIGNRVDYEDTSPYNHGDVVTLTPVAAQGWQFDHWMVGETSLTDNPLNLTITGNMVVTAYFTEIEYSLTLIANPAAGGTITPDVVGPYHLNEMVTLTANANPGYAFTGWSVPECTGTEPCTVTITGDTEVTAYFTQEKYFLDVQTVGSGTVVKAPNQELYDYHQMVTLTATANPGWTFAGWEGACSGNGNCQVIMDGDIQVIAVFTEDEYILDIVIYGEGTVTPDDTGPYLYGHDVVLTAVPADGWALSGWSVEGCSGETCSVTLYGDRAVIVTFTQLIEYPLNTIVDGGGSILRNPDGETYLRHTIVQLTAVPDPGWEFGYWEGSCTGTGNPCIVIMDGERSVTAVFRRKWSLPKNLITEAGTVLEGFEDQSQWTVTGSGSGFRADTDTVNVKEGSASLKLTTPASGNVTVTKNVSWDLSQDQGDLRLWVYNAGTDEPSGGSIILYTDLNTTSTNYFVTYYGGAFKLRYKPGWNLINLRTSDWRVIGSPRWDNIVRIRIRLDSRAANTYSFDVLTTGTQAMPAVVFTFDNGMDSLYSEAFAYMQSRHVRGTGYIPTNLVGEAGQVTWEQILEMFNAGWTIGNQTSTNVDLTTRSYEDQVAELLAAQEALLSHGILNAGHVAYPFGKYNDDTLAAMQALGMLTGRSLLTFDNLLPLGSPFEIAQRNIVRSTSLSTAESWVNTAIARQEVLVISFQGISATPGLNDWYITRFIALVDYCISNNIPILTMNDLYQLQAGEITIPTPVEIGEIAN